MAMLLERTVVSRARRGQAQRYVKIQVERYVSRKVGTGRDRDGDRVPFKSQGETQAGKLHKREDQK